MSSNAMDTRQTKCLLCSACCDIGIKFGPATVIQPDYPDYAEGRLGICARGHYIVDLLSHPSRLTGAYLRKNGKRQLVPTSDGVRAVSDRLKKLGLGNHIGLLVDGNVPCETLVGLAQFTKTVLRSQSFSIYIPPTDQALLEGIGATQAAILSLSELAACDVILAVGDPFSMAPVLARSVQDARNAQRGNRLIVIDPLLGRTARYATDHLPISPGAESLVLAAIAVESGRAKALASALRGRSAANVAGVAGVPASAISSAAQAIKSAKKLGVVIGLAEGSTNNPAAVAAIAATLAEPKGGGVVPALAYGNAVGAFRVSHSVGAVPLGRLLRQAASGELKALLVFGKDLLQDFAAAECADALRKLDFLAAALPIPGRISDLAKVVLPGSFWFEDEGTVIDFSGTRTDILSLMAPPGAARTTMALAEEIAAGLAPDAAIPVELTAEHLVARKVGDPAEMVKNLDAAALSPQPGDCVLLPRQTTMNSYDGWLTMACRWGETADGRPVARINPDDLAASRIRNRCVFTVSSEKGNLQLIAAADSNVPTGIIAVPAHIASRSGLIGKGIDADSGALLTGPAIVQLSTQAETE